MKGEAENSSISTRVCMWVENLFHSLFPSQLLYSRLLVVPINHWWHSSPLYWIQMLLQFLLDPGCFHFSKTWAFYTSVDTLLMVCKTTGLCDLDIRYWDDNRSSPFRRVGEGLRSCDVLVVIGHFSLKWILRKWHADTLSYAWVRLCSTGW